MLPKEPVEILSGNRPAQFFALCLTNVAPPLARLRRKRLRSDLLYATALQPQHPVAAPRKCQVMSCDKRGELVLAMESRYQFEDRFRCLSIKVSRRLIRQQ